MNNRAELEKVDAENYRLFDVEIELNEEIEVCNTVIHLLKNNNAVLLAELAELRNQKPIATLSHVTGLRDWGTNVRRINFPYDDCGNFTGFDVYARPVPEIPESASQSNGIVPVPEGYALVPIKPNAEMLSVGVGYFKDTHMDIFNSGIHYSLMLAASQKDVKL
jgi:hypothetical protein